MSSVAPLVAWVFEHLTILAQMAFGVASFAKLVAMTAALFMIHGESILSQREADSRKQVFNGADGRPVAGEDWNIVSMQHMTSDLSRAKQRLPFGPNYRHQSFWYCIGPGPDYLMAILDFQRLWEDMDIRWTSRSLSEEQFRAALTRDRKALLRMEQIKASHGRDLEVDRVRG